jgi:hypothetical protein
MPRMLSALVLVLVSLALAASALAMSDSPVVAPSEPLTTLLLGLGLLAVGYLRRR